MRSEAATDDERWIYGIQMVEPVDAGTLDSEICA
jgi:hypothetical protein